MRYLSNPSMQHILQYQNLNSFSHHFCYRAVIGMKQVVMFWRKLKRLNSWKMPTKKSHHQRSLDQCIWKSFRINFVSCGWFIFQNSWSLLGNWFQNMLAMMILSPVLFFENRRRWLHISIQLHLCIGNSYWVEMKFTKKKPNFIK